MEEEVLIDVRFDLNDFAQKAATLRKGLSDLRMKNKELKKDVDAGTKSSAESAKQLALNEKTIKEHTATLKAMDGQIQASVDTNKEYGDSLQEQRARLSQLQNQYASLSKAERESAKGDEILNKLRELRKEVGDTEKSMGDFRRDVGNYPQTITAIIPGFDKLNGTLGKMGGSIQELATKGSAGFAALGKSAVAMGRLFLTPPIGIIVAILSAIMIVIQKVSAAFKKNDDAATRLSKAFAVLQPIMTALEKIFDALATAISYAVEWIVKLAAKIIQNNIIFKAFAAIFPSVVQGMADAAVAAQELVVAQDNLEEAERRYTVNSAKRNKDIAKLRADVADKEKYTAQQRIDMLKQAGELERQNLEELKSNKAEELRILEETAKQNVDTSDETKDKIAAARAALYDAEKAYFAGIQSLQGEITSAEQEINAEVEAEAKKRADVYKAAADAELAAIRKLEDEILKAVTDSVDKQVQQIQLGSQREIEDLRKRLETEKNLTVAARQAIIDAIKQIEVNAQADIDKIREEQEKRLSDRAIAAETERINLLLAAARQGSEERYNLQAQLIERQRTQALAAEELTQQEILNIHAKYDAMLLEQEDARIKRQADEQKQALLNDVEARRQSLLGDEVALAQLEQEQALMEQENLLNMDTATKAALFENQAAYEAAVLASNAKVKDSTIATFRTQQTMAENQAKVFSAVTGAINNMFSELAGDNAEFAAFSKVLALAEASVQLGLAIAAASTTAAKSGDPYTVAARIASAVGGVVAAFVGVVSSIKSAKIPATPKFAQGGIVPGKSYSGDNVMARVNSGEMILNAQQQARLFEIANARTASPGLDYEQLAEMTASAVAALPPPVMDYSEFTTFQANLTKYDEYASLR